MNLHELSPAPGSKRVAVRVGRGLGSGLGKTSGKGQKSLLYKLWASANPLKRKSLQLAVRLR